MPAHGKYYVVEYRYAIRIDDANNVMTAVARANEIAEKKFGFRPKNWFA